jgi:RimJ/RimL family protein N-acetyltransferase
MRTLFVVVLFLLLFAGCATEITSQEMSDKKEIHMQRIETERLVLRSFTEDDWRDFQELAVDWKAAPGPAFDKWRTSDEACRESVQYMSTKGNYFAMCLRESGKVVGLLGINGIDEEKQADLGHVILSSYQDDDHDREALQAMVQHCFNMKGAQSIITHNASTHVAQVAPLKSLGFVNTNPDDPGELTLSKAQWEQGK